MSFCQNHEIAQEDLDARCETITPEELVEKAVELVPYGNIGIAFTYNEPMMSWEFIRDTGSWRKKGFEGRRGHEWQRELEGFG